VVVQVSRQCRNEAKVEITEYQTLEVWKKTPQQQGRCSIAVERFHASQTQVGGLARLIVLGDGRVGFQSLDATGFCVVAVESPVAGAGRKSDGSTCIPLSIMH